MSEKSLPPTPNDSSAPEPFWVDGIEALHLEKYDHKPPLEVVSPQGLEREYEGLEHQRDGHASTHELKTPGSAPEKTTKKKWIVATSILVVVVVALAAGLGAGLRHKSKNRSRGQVLSVSPSWVPFNSTPSLSASTVKPSDWRSRSIYQVMTDRFGPSDQSSPACDTSSRQYCGGTWKGITDRLDYIQNMGFTAVWISPVTAQLPENTAEGEAYHGYWQQNLWSLNTEFGTNDDLKALSQALHSRNMYLMVDVVVNHFGWAGNHSTVNYSKLYPFTNGSSFHPYCPITAEDYVSNQTAVEQCWLGDDIVSLVDVDTTKASVIETYNSWIKSLVSTYGIDGLRIDTVKHVQKSFWPSFQSAAGVYCVGEVFGGDVGYTCPYQEQLDGVLNYPLYYPLTRAFQSSSGNITDLVLELGSVNTSCRDPTLLGTFSENHDNPRFPSLTEDISLAMNIIAFTILTDGIPIIYQGQEQHFSGGNDPGNREALWTSAYSTKAPLYTFIASVNQIRNQEIYKSPAYLTSRASVVYSDDHNIAVRKAHILTVFTNTGSNPPSENLTLSHTGFGPNEQMVEILTCSDSTISTDGSLDVSLDSGRPQAPGPWYQFFNDN